MLVAVTLAIAAALGTVAGLFIGMPVAGYALWPVTRVLASMLGADLDRRPHDHPIVQLESAAAAGLGMGLGVGMSVLLVGVAIAADSALTAAANAGSIAALTFGPLWHLGYARRSAAPLVVATAILAAAAAAWSS